MSQSLFTVSDFDSSFYKRLFARALEIESGAYKSPQELQSKSLGLLFFEPSSRTNWSFQKAGLDLGLRVMSTYVDEKTSLSKGESSQDTLELFINMGFDLIVTRSKFEDQLKDFFLKRTDQTFINAGFGSFAHPTQALLDAYTWSKDWSSQEAPKILILGDLKHSRVVRSHLRLASILGYQVGLCPLSGLGLEASEYEEFKPSEVFESREKALDWADIVMPLRAQKERFLSESQKSYVPKPLRADELKERHWLMHPGPITWGEDMENELMRYSKSLISQQQKSGVTCRAALISLLLEETTK